MVVISVHCIIQKARLQNADVMGLCFWYTFLGTVISFGVSAIFETLTLPTSSREWLLLVGHCFGSAGFAIFTTIAQKLASLIVLALAFGSAVLFHFLAQFLIFQEMSSGFGLVIEVGGAVLRPVHTVGATATCDGDVRQGRRFR